MFKKFALIALPALALAIGFGVAARAEQPCEASVKEVQAKWDKMYPMGMDRPSTNYQTITDNFRIAKEKCKEGKTV
ncbi:MAG: hypothetical protein H7Y60_09595 [Rhodospirillaceae bacterium]|nr:hypothetical protein [Rhodospirillales bacterium]